MNFQNLHRALLVIFCHLLHYRTSPLTSIHLLTLYSLIHQIYTLKNTMTPSLIASAWSYIQSSFKRPYSTEARCVRKKDCDITVPCHRSKGRLSIHHRRSRMSLACMQDDLLGPSWQLWQWMVTVIAPKDSES